MIDVTIAKGTNRCLLGGYHLSFLIFNEISPKLLDVLLANVAFKLRLGLLWGQIFFQLGKDEIVSIIWISVYVE